MQVPDNVVAAIKTAVGTGKVLTAVPNTPPPLPEQPKREPKVIQKRSYQLVGEVSEGLDADVALPPIDRGGIKIEADVPMPKKSAKNAGESRYPFHRMKVGESFFVKMIKDDDETIRKAISAMSSASYAWRKRANKMHLKFANRRVEGGIRCWRTE